MIGAVLARQWERAGPRDHHNRHPHLVGCACMVVSVRCAHWKGAFCGPVNHRRRAVNDHDHMPFEYFIFFFFLSHNHSARRLRHVSKDRCFRCDVCMVFLMCFQECEECDVVCVCDVLMCVNVTSTNNNLFVTALCVAPRVCVGGPRHSLSLSSSPLHCRRRASSLSSSCVVFSFGTSKKQGARSKKNGMWDTSHVGSAATGSGAVRRVQGRGAGLSKLAARRCCAERHTVCPCFEGRSAGGYYV